MYPRICFFSLWPSQTLGHVYESNFHIHIHATLILSDHISIYDTQKMVQYKLICFHSSTRQFGAFVFKNLRGKELGQACRMRPFCFLKLFVKFLEFLEAKVHYFQERVKIKARNRRSYWQMESPTLITMQCLTN